MRKVFIDPARCIGCKQCEIACATAHSLSKDIATAHLEVPIPRARIHVDPGPVIGLSYPSNCRHCDPAPCIGICPSGAMHRDGDLVLVDDRACIGCAMCAVVCPFDVIGFYPTASGLDQDTAVAVKCDLCVDRLREGALPACVEACKVGALSFGDVNDVVTGARRAHADAVFAAVEAVDDPLAGWRANGVALRNLVSLAETATFPVQPMGAQR